MNYEKAILATVTQKQARHEILEHGLKFTDFVIDCGDKPFYKGKTVLDWIGY